LVNKHLISFAHPKLRICRAEACDSPRGLSVTIGAIAKTVAEFTSRQDGTIRQQVILPWIILGILGDRWFVLALVLALAAATATTVRQVRSRSLKILDTTTFVFFFFALVVVAGFRWMVLATYMSLLVQPSSRSISQPGYRSRTRPARRKYANIALWNVVSLSLRPMLG
jgi:hypothetical protein